MRGHPCLLWSGTTRSPASSSALDCPICNRGVCGYAALNPHVGEQGKCMGHLVGWSDFLELAGHTGSGVCAGPRYQKLNALMRWIFTIWDWLSVKGESWNEKYPHAKVSPHQLARLQYFLATDISEANLEPNPARWYYSRPALESKGDASSSRASGGKGP